MFEIKNISKQFGEEYALRNVTMEIGTGLNFIIGSSGSGKTTLLKIISGMEQDFDGDALYCGQNIKTLTEQEKSYFYNNIFGFVWQDFNLLDDLTVLENVMLPAYLKECQDKKAVMKILRELKISELANQRAGKLSGGQKQRVAIARELIKNPAVIIADEPTSALDESSAKITMDILRDISKNRTVIVVTHDTSLIGKNSKVYELDKGELVTAQPVQKNIGKIEKQKPHKLSLINAWQIARTNTKSNAPRLVATTLSLLIASTLLLVTLSGSIQDSSQDAFNELFKAYGEGILDISVVSSFMSANGTSGNEQDGPSADVSQNIDGLYDRYKADERIQHIVFSQAFRDMQIRVDGKDYTVKAGGNTPNINEVLEGRMPGGDGHEVVVPDSFVEKMGITNKEALGKTIEFVSGIYNWETGEPVPAPVKTTAKIVGVVDSTVKYEYDGAMFEFAVDDSFFFSKSALDEMRTQAKNEKTAMNFIIRAKTPADLIAIKDELNADGIVPLGNFELVEDMVRLNNQTVEQSSSAIAVIGLLSVVVVLAVSIITAFTRKREYAIYKVSGYSKGHLTVMTAWEFCIASIISGISFLFMAPIINIATTSLWKVNILNGKLLSVGVLLILATGVLSLLVTAIVSGRAKASASLKTGDR